MTIKLGKSVFLQAVTMINPASGLIEIHTLPSTRVDIAANQVELAWLTCYLLPNKVIVDMGNEFPIEFKEMITNDYVLTVKPNTSSNPQVN